MQAINVLSIQRTGAAERARIEAVDPRVRLIDAGGWFDGEIRETWTDFAAARYLLPNSTGSGSREERDRLLAVAEVIIGGWPFPRELRARAPQLNWFHQQQAGASNLLGSDLWGSEGTRHSARAGGTRVVAGQAGDHRADRGCHQAPASGRCAGLGRRQAFRRRNCLA
jgi:hypothetical protein